MLNLFLFLLEHFISRNFLLIDFALLFIFTFYLNTIKKLEIVLSFSKFVIHGFFESVHTSHDFNTFLEFTFLLVLHFSELDILFGDGNIPRGMVEVHRSQIACWCVDDSFLLIECPSLSFDWSSRWLQLITLIFVLLSIFVLNISLCLRFCLLFSILPLILWTRIPNGFDLLYHIIPHTDHMNLSINPVTTTSDVTIKWNINLVIFCVPFILISLPSVS